MYSKDSRINIDDIIISYDSSNQILPREIVRILIDSAPIILAGENQQIRVNVFSPSESEEHWTKFIIYGEGIDIASIVNYKEVAAAYEQGKKAAFREINKTINPLMIRPDFITGKSNTNEDQDFYRDRKFPEGLTVAFDTQTYMCHEGLNLLQKIRYNGQEIQGHYKIIPSWWPIQPTKQRRHLKLVE